MNWPLSVIGSDPTKSSPHLKLSQAFFDSPRINAVYVHIPFCFHKCHYCDFYSIVDSPGPNNRQPQFLDTLILELHRRSGQLHLRPHTLFVGGGTPTYLAPPLWTRFLSSFHEHRILDEVAEFTVEANPETVTSALLDQLVHGGVNRISMGAQSFQPDLLKTLERWHDPASVAHACNLARQAGIRNLNLDLIFAIPGQTMAQLDADLDALLTLEPQHLSCYGLTYEPGTALLEKLQLGRVQRLDEDLEKVMFEHVITRLTWAGYEQYEISNFALPGQQCQHNLHYWANDNWLGLGPAAASHVNGYRWKNAPPSWKIPGKQRGTAHH
ncbi:MAG: radical SAM family heme chaperone HemW [Phycisphaerales bacterium]|nr:radical SAM family heme chaperone HemW [Phycisphaerales bacterium]